MPKKLKGGARINRVKDADFARELILKEASEEYGLVLK